MSNTSDDDTSALATRSPAGGRLVGKPDVTLDSLVTASMEAPSATGVDPYRGPATVVWDATGTAEQRRIRLGLYWQPSPHVSLQLEETPDDGEPRAGRVWIELPGTRGALEGWVSYHTFTADLSDPPSTRGVPYIAQGSVQAGELGGGRLREIQFGIVNLPALMELKESPERQGPHWGPVEGPVVLTGAGWRVSVETLAIDVGHGRLGSSSVTHVGRLERLTGRTFWPLQAHRALTGLGALLTFARGAQVGPGLAVATDAKGDHQWSLWEWDEFERLDEIDFPTDTWLGDDHAGGLKAAFPPWMAAWSNDRMRPRLSLTVSLRADAAARRADTGIVVGQQALEQLAWLLLGSEAGLDRLRPSDRLRGALSTAGRTADVPEGLQPILDEEGWEDGARAIVEVRNSLVHPTPANQLSPWVLEAMEAWRALVLFYIDVLVLALIDYEAPPGE